MQIKINNMKELGAAAKLIRQAQSLDQKTAGLLSGNGLTFISQFENGKDTVETGRILELFDQLGIEIQLNLPPNLPDKTIEKLAKLFDIDVGSMNA